MTFSTFDAAVEALGVHLRGIRIAPETHHQAGIRAGAQDVPEFLLTQEIITLRGGLVVRMHPQRHAALDVQHAHADRELPAVVFVYIVPDHTVEIGIHQFGETVARQPSLADQRIAISQVRELEFLAAPGVIVLQGAELDRI